MEKIYRCCICHKILKKYKPIRLVEQKYGYGKYSGQYGQVTKFDFCETCYSKFNRWIINHKDNKY